MLGARLAQLRQGKGWKQGELSRLLRLSLALGAGLDELVFGTAATLEGEWHRIQRELEKAGGPLAIDCATRVLQALLLGFQS